MPQDVSLTIRKQARSYAFQLQLPEALGGPTVLWAQGPCGGKSFQQLFARKIETLNAFLPHRHQPVPADGRPAEDPLLPLGMLIYSQLFPPELQRVLHALPEGTPLTIATNDPQIPWELAHDGETYLALKHPTTRHLVLYQPRQRGSAPPPHAWSSLLIGVLDDDLPRSRDEIDALYELIRGLPGIAEPEVLLSWYATKDAVLNELRSGKYDLIHFSGHALFDAQHPERSGIALAKGEILTPTEIAKDLRGRPIVFLNACASGREGEQPKPTQELTYFGQAVCGLAPAFIQGGAQAVLGTFWPIADDSACELALEFYRAAGAGSPIGRALQQARERARRAAPHNPIWASYLLYGEPDLPLLRVSTTHAQLATVLVAQLHGLENLFVRVPAEEATHSVQTHWDILADQIARYGGQVSNLAHDTLIGVFGLQGTQSNDAERAVRAALGMVAMCESLHRGHSPHGLDVSIGVGSSRILVRDAEGRTLVSPVITGEALNQAARLARQASPRTVLLTPATRELVGHLIDTELYAPGASHDSQPPAAYRVLGLRRALDPLQERFVQHQRMIGREDQMRLLQEAWQKSRRGQRWIVSLQGEAGVGKSRLLYEFRQRLRGEDTQWLYGSCPTAYEAAPYELVSQLLHSLLGIASAGEEHVSRERLRSGLQRLLEGASSEQEIRLNLAIVGEIIALPFPEVSLANLDSGQRRRSIKNILQRLLAERVRQAPLILVLEDVDRADDASLGVLGDLLAGRDGWPILVITLSRTQVDWEPTRQNWPNRRSETLDNLDDGESLELLAALLGVAPRDLPAGLAQLVGARARGNPLFVGELVAALQESKTLARGPDGWTLFSLDKIELPGSLERLLLVRIGDLPTNDLEVLRILAVAGDSLRRPVLDHLASEAVPKIDLEASLTTLRARQFIGDYLDGEEEVYSFRHALFQEVAYGSLLEEQRRSYHCRLGWALEQVCAERARAEQEQGAAKPSVAEVQQLALHFTRGEIWDKALVYQLRAGQQALDLFYSRMALAYLTAAQQIAETRLRNRVTPAQRLAYREGLGDAHSNLGEFESALAHYREGYRLIKGDPNRAAALCGKIATVYEHQTCHAQAIRWLGRGLANLDAVRPTDPAIHSRICLQYGMIRIRQGKLEEAKSWAKEALIVETAQAHNLMAVICREQGDLTAARRHCEWAIELAKATHDQISEARAYTNLGVILFSLDEWQGSREAQQKALERQAEIGDAYAHAMALCNLSDVERHLGYLDRALADAQAGLKAHGDLGHPFGQALAHLNWGEALTALGQPAPARTEHLELARELLVSHGIKDLLFEVERGLAESFFAEGRLPEAGVAAQRALAVAEEQGTASDAGSAQRLLGSVYAAQGQTAEAEGLLARSIAALEQHGPRYELGLARLALARVYAMGQARRAEAQLVLEQARGIFQALGATLDLQRADDLASRLGAE